MSNEEEKSQAILEGREGPKRGGRPPLVIICVVALFVLMFGTLAVVAGTPAPQVHSNRDAETASAGTGDDTGYGNGIPTPTPRPRGMKVAATPTPAPGATACATCALGG